MLSAWAPHARPVGAPRLTYGRSMAKAMDVFNLDHARWPELAADRAGWRAMLQSGEAPPSFRQPPAPALPMPISHPLVELWLCAPPACCGGVRTNAAIDASLRAEVQTTRLGKFRRSGRLADARSLTPPPLALIYIYVRLLLLVPEHILFKLGISWRAPALHWTI